MMLQMIFRFCSWPLSGLISLAFWGIPAYGANAIESRPPGMWGYPQIRISVPVNTNYHPELPKNIKAALKMTGPWVVLGNFSPPEMPGLDFMLAINRVDHGDGFPIVVESFSGGYKSFPLDYFLSHPGGQVPVSIRKSILEGLYRNSFDRLSKLMGGVDKINAAIDAKYTISSPLNTSREEIELFSKNGIRVRHYCIVDLTSITLKCLNK